MSKPTLPIVVRLPMLPIVAEPGATGTPGSITTEGGATQTAAGVTFAGLLRARVAQPILAALARKAPPGPEPTPSKDQPAQLSVSMPVTNPPIPILPTPIPVLTTLPPEAPGADQSGSQPSAPAPHPVASLSPIGYPVADQIASPLPPGSQPMEPSGVPAPSPASLPPAVPMPPAVIRPQTPPAAMPPAPSEQLPVQAKPPEAPGADQSGSQPSAPAPHPVANPLPVSYPATDRSAWPLPPVPQPIEPSDIAASSPASLPPAVPMPPAVIRPQTPPAAMPPAPSEQLPVQAKPPEPPQTPPVMIQPRLSPGVVPPAPTLPPVDGGLGEVDHLAEQVRLSGPLPQPIAPEPQADLPSQPIKVAQPLKQPVPSVAWPDPRPADTSTPAEARGPALAGDPMPLARAAKPQPPTSATPPEAPPAQPIAGREPSTSHSEADDRPPAPHAGPMPSEPQENAGRRAVSGPARYEPAAEPEPPHPATPAVGNAPPAPLANEPRTTMPAPISVHDLRFVTQVADRIQQQARTGTSHAWLRLQPESLGRVDVHLTLDSTGLHLQLNTETPEAGMLFERNLNQLRDALLQRGVNIHELSVSVSTGFDSAPNPGPGQHSPAGAEMLSSAAPPARRGAAASDPSFSPTQSVEGQGQRSLVDYRV